MRPLFYSLVQGLFCELLWSDPSPIMGRQPNKRGVGIGTQIILFNELAFGPDVTHKFLQDNGLDLLIRSHEVKEEGYLVEADGKLITVFSAPNYCDQVRALRYTKTYTFRLEIRLPSLN